MQPHEQAIQPSFFARLKAIEQERVILAFVLIGVAVMGTVSAIGEGDVNFLLGNLATELAGAVFTFFVFQLIIERRDKRKEHEHLIEEMGSIVNDVALDAVEKLRKTGKLQDGTLAGVDLWKANLARASLQDTNLARSRLHQANLAEANLEEANLTGAYSEDANLAGANLLNANLSGAYLREVNLSGAILYGANLSGAVLWLANIEGAYLLQANLSGANLMVANLSGADLLNANLTGANLMGANLKGANLAGDDLSGANFREANLDAARLDSAHFDEHTTLPDNTKWTPESDIMRFTDPNHPNFWRSSFTFSPAYRAPDND